MKKFTYLMIAALTTGAAFAQDSGPQKGSGAPAVTKAEKKAKKEAKKAEKEAKKAAKKAKKAADSSSSAPAM